jgi:hypothetical protein
MDANTFTIFVSMQTIEQSNAKRKREMNLHIGTKQCQKEKRMNLHIGTKCQGQEKLL